MGKQLHWRGSLACKILPPSLLGELRSEQVPEGRGEDVVGGMTEDSTGAVVGGGRDLELSEGRGGRKKG